MMCSSKKVSKKVGMVKGGEICFATPDGFQRMGLAKAGKNKLASLFTCNLLICKCFCNSIFAWERLVKSELPAFMSFLRVATAYVGKNKLASLLLCNIKWLRVASFDPYYNKGRDTLPYQVSSPLGI